MASIFLSYSRKDAPHVAIIRRALEDAGLSVWQDLDLPRGPKYRAAIHAQLDAAACVLVLWSTHCDTSDWVPDEADRARDRLLPVTIGDATLPLGLGEYNAYRLAAWPESTASEDLAPLVRAARLRVEHTVFIAGAPEDLAAFRPASKPPAPCSCWSPTATLPSPPPRPKRRASSKSSSCPS